MPRGIRRDTYDRVVEARSRKPLALGPYLGELAVKANITAGTVARIVGAHEQTVFRWFFGHGEVQPLWALKVAQVVTLLAWMHSTNRVPLMGTLEEKEALLQHHTKEFRDLARGQKDQFAA